MFGGARDRAGDHVAVELRLAHARRREGGREGGGIDLRRGGHRRGASERRALAFAIDRTHRRRGDAVVDEARSRCLARHERALVRTSHGEVDEWKKGGLAMRHPDPRRRLFRVVRGTAARRALLPLAKGRVRGRGRSPTDDARDGPRARGSRGGLCATTNRAGLGARSPRRETGPGAAMDGTRV